MKRPFLALFLAILATLTGGCVSSRTYRLPAIRADEINVTHTDWAGTIQARAKGLRVTETFYYWDEAEWILSYGGWQDHVVARGFRQRRDKAAEEAEEPK